MNNINTDLTESDFIPELKLEEKMHILQTHSYFKPENGIAIASMSEIPKNPPSIQSYFIKKLFLGYLIIKFVRKLKNAIIFPTKVSEELKNKSFLFMNDRSFIPGGISNKTVKKTNKFNGIISELFNYIRENFLMKILTIYTKNALFFDDSSTFIKIWDFLQLTLIFIIIYMIPMNIFFTRDIIINPYEKMLILSYLFFFIDIIMKFIRKWPHIVKNYVKSLFWLDLLSICSLFFWDVCPMITLLFLLKIWYVQKVNQINLSYIKIPYLPLIVFLLRTIVYILLFSHYIACIWCSVGDFGSKNYTNSWIVDGEMSKNQYIYALYFCFQILVFDGNNIIQPTNKLEIFCVFIFKIIAIFHLIYVIIKAAFLLRDIYRNEKDSRDDLKSLNNFIRKNNKINADTKSEIKNIYQDVLKKKNKNRILENHQKILEILPESIIKNIPVELPLDVKLKNFPVFTQNFSSASLEKLPQYFKKKKFYQNENIFTQGSLDDKFLFLILKGKVTLCLPFQEEKMKIKKKYDILGFESFFCDKPNSFTVKVLSKKVTVWMLSQEDFSRVLKEKQEDYDKFCEIRDKIQFERNFEDLKLNCKCCLSKTHEEIQCPLILKNFNRKLYIQKLSFYQPNYNRRSPFPSRKKIKTRFFIFKKQKELNMQLFVPDYEFQEEDSENLDNLEKFGRESIDIDKINLKMKDNYFPQNHYVKIIYEYNEMIRKKSPSNGQFLSSNFSCDLTRECYKS